MAKRKRKVSEPTAVAPPKPPAVEPVGDDESERVRIRRAEPGDSLFIEAGAGTGKTTLLVEHVLGLLARPEADLRRLAIITFTEKAAAELRQRLLLGLEQRRDAATRASDENLVSYWQAQLDRLDQASVGTIHSFCLSILRRWPVEARLDPQARVAREDELEDLAGACWAEFLRTVKVESPAWESMLQVAMARVSDEALRKLADAVAGPLTCGTALPERLADPVGAWRDAVGQSVADRLEEVLALCDDGDDKLFLALQPWVQWLAGDPPGPDCPPVNAEGVASLGNVGAAKAWSVGGKDELVALRRELAAKLGEAAVQYGVYTTHNALVTVLDALRPYAAAVDQAKRAAGLISFDDILVHCRALLDHDAVRADEAARLDRILVDEFQDTDRLQAEIVQRLAGDEPGRLVVVGDPKQSIYRFRQADLAVYGKVGASLGDRATVRIFRNFRTHAALLSALNPLFDAVLAPETDATADAANPELVQAANTRLVAGRVEPASASVDGDPRLDVLLYSGEALPAGEARQMEAEALARRIRQLLDSDTRVYDRRTRSYVPIRPGHVAVLYSAATSLRYLEWALQEVGVEYHIHGSKTFYRSDAVEAVRWILSAMADPTDRWAVVCALRSSLLGCSDEDVLRLHLASRAGLDYRSVDRRELGRSSPAAAAAVETLAALHADAGRLPLDQVVERVLDATQALAFQALRPSGAQAAANLGKLVEQARQFDQQPGATLGGFVAQLARLAGSGFVDERESDLGRPPEQHIQLMTVHQSKGLEFNVVGLYEFGRERRVGATDVGVFERGVAGRRQVEARLRFAAVEGDREQWTTVGFEAAAARDERHLQAEHRRLLYVACTRAMDRLIVPLVARKAGGESWERIVRAVAGWGGEAPPSVPANVVPIAELPAPAQAAAASVASRLFRAAAEGRAEGPREVDPAGFAAGRAERLAAIASAPAILAPSVLAHEIEPRDHLPAPEDDGVRARRAESQRFGQAFHTLMERLDLRRTTLPDDDPLVAAVAVEQGVPTRTAELARLARTALASPTMGEVRAALQAGRLVHREVPFCLPWTADLKALASADGELLQGVMDLLVQTESGWLIVDYKTDQVPTAQRRAELEAQYGVQTALYRQAAERLIGDGRPVRPPALLFVRAVP